MTSASNHQYIYVYKNRIIDMRFDRGRDEQKVKQWKKQTSKEIRLKSNFFRSYKLLQAVFSQTRDSSKIVYSFHNIHKYSQQFHECDVYFLAKMLISCHKTLYWMPVHEHHVSSVKHLVNFYELAWYRLRIRETIRRIVTKNTICELKLAFGCVHS